MIRGSAVEQRFRQPDQPPSAIERLTPNRVMPPAAVRKVSAGASTDLVR